MSLPNPYTPGESPRVLVGRESQSERARQSLSRVSNLGEAGGPLVVLRGPRGVGKTSLLRDVERVAQEAGLVSAWISCHRRKPFLVDLVERVDYSLNATDAIRPPGKRAKVETLGLEVGIPAGVRLSAQFGKTSGVQPVTVSVPALQDTFHNAAALVRQHHGAGLAVFIDELHAGDPNDLAVLLNAIQNINGQRHQNPIAFFAAGLPSVSTELTKAATFGERSTFITLPRLSYGDAAEAIVAPAAELGVQWDKDTLRIVLDACDGFPYLLQVRAHATWEAAKPEAGATLDFDDMVQGATIASEQLNALYEARWTAASDLEQQIMVAMASQRTPTVHRGAIAAALNRSSRSLSVPRDRLIDKGIIEPADHGSLRFTLPGFDEFVLASIDDVYTFDQHGSPRETE